MTYPPMTDSAAVNDWLAAAQNLIRTEGLACDTISNGGTPNLGGLGAYTVATEHRAGTYIYNDRSLIARGACGIEDCAATVRATIVSRPTKTRAIIDAGSKTLNSDLLGLEGHGLIREPPDAKITALAEEHGTIDLSGTDWRPEIGDVISIIPNHICVVSNLFETLTLVHQDGESEEVAVAARGKLR